MGNQVHFFDFAPVRCVNLVAGITAVIGIIGSVFLLTRTTQSLVGKLNERNRKKSLDERHFCNVCCTEINPEDVKSFVKCWLCLKSTCRSFKCANWLPKVALWECDLCQKSKESMAQTSSWVAEQFSFNEDKLVYPLRARSEIFIPINECNDNTINFDSVSQIGANSTIITAEQKLKIREYVEEIVSKLLGGNLDTISVNQLSKSENYLSPPKSVEQNGTILSNGDITTKRNYNQNNADFGDISEARLRQMIQKIIAETMSMPPLTMNHAVSEVALDRPSKTSAKHTFKNGYRHRTEHYFEPKIYQDLLATAVLNKIVDTQGNNRIISESTPDLSQSNQSNDMDQNYNVENQSTSSGSSVEPRSDCSYSEMDRILNNQINKPAESPLDPGRESTMSDYLAGHMVPLPDLSNVPTESEEDDFVSITSSAKGEGTWEHNWLFKKKHSSLGGSGTTATILIPIPKEDVRAQIGDKATDEVSDLSELGSETDDSSSGLLSTKMDPLNDRLLNKHIIGGQNSKSVLDELIESSSVPINNLPSEQDETYTDTLNEHVVDAPPKNEAINDEINKIETIDSETERKPSTDQITNEYCSSNNTPTTDEEFIEIGLDVEIEHKQQQSQSNHNNNNNNINNTYVRLVNNNGNAIPTTTPNTCNKKKNNNSNNNNHNKNNIDHHYHHYHHNNTTSGREASAVEVTTLKAEQIIIGQNNKIEDYKDDDIDNQILEREHVDDMVAVQPKFVPGSIAEREYLKWHNAVDMPNNPYAPEALKKRINGSQERCMDLPNISPGKEANPLEHITKEKLNDETDNKREIEYKRYSRDYYINNVSKSNESPSKSGSAEQYTEVNLTKQATENHIYTDTQRLYNDCHWTLAAPVRRSCSLKLLSHNNSKTNHNRHQTVTRCASSVSQYENTKCFVKNSNTISPLKRRTVSMLSVCSVGSSGRGSKQSLHDSNQHLWSHFEKQLLHKDLKRNSFRATSSTTVDFVLNPLFEGESSQSDGGADNENVNFSNSNLKKCENTHDDQAGDSGVDSCLNGFTGKEIKMGNENRKDFDSLLF